MVRRRVLARSLAVLVLVMVVATGCAWPLKTEKPTPGGLLTVGLLRAPTGVFRPLVSEERDAALVTQLMYSGLLRLGPKLELVCDLCSEYSVSEDRRTLTFRLRENVQWHDGKPFTAADVRFTYQALLAPDYTGSQTGRLAALAGVQALLDERDAVDRDVTAGRISLTEGTVRKTAAWKRWLEGTGAQAVTAVDPHTVTFRMSEPYAPLLTAMLLPVAPAHTREPVGTGPFKLAEFKKGDLVRLVRHDAYHMGKPYLDEVSFKVVPPGQGPALFKAGALDFLPVSAREAAELGEERLVSWPSPGYQYLGLNLDRPIFTDRRVRQALLLGIDRSGLVNSLLGGYGTVVNTHAFPGHWALGEGRLNEYPYSPEKAATLLTEAGWGTLDEEGYRVRDGARLGFVLKYPKGNPVREKSAEVVQRNLKAIGVKVDLQMLEFGELIREVFGERKADAWLLGWDLGTDPDPGPVFSPDNKWGQASGWSSPRSEELLRQGRSVLGTAERQPVYGEWLTLVNEELPYLFLYAENELGVFSSRVRGVAADARGPLWNIWELWIANE